MDLSNWGEFKKQRKADSQVYDPNIGLVVGWFNKYGPMDLKEGQKHIMLGAFRDHLALSFN